ncbi:MAG: alpha/beta hydrolase fold domain-containing protein [Opitutae bacterium]|nr:alpha/beta hydrolase fold domain-containing protein [Opitutae bacterium]
MNLLKHSYSILFTLLFAVRLLGDSPVDRSLSTALVSDDFGLADGPSWQGWYLTVPDPKAQVVKRFIIKQNKWSVLAQEKRFSASFFNHGKSYFADHGEGAIRCLDQNNNWSLLHQEDLTKDKRRKPNDLVVDRSGGVYFTLTGPGEVVYLSSTGKAKTVASDVETPNGLILSPDEKTLYVSEYVPKKILSFKVGKNGALNAKKLFAKMDDGQPDLKGADGMCVDRAGNVYCAGPKDIWIWDSKGKLLDKIVCPERAVNCTFGGSQLRDLYLTGFGGVYVQRMKLSGVPPQPPAEWPDSMQDKPSIQVPGNVTQLLDLTYAEYGPRKMLADLFIPKGKGPFPAALIIHGGGWIKGDKMKFRAMGVEMAKRGYVSMAIDYRLAEEALFPANIQDCHASVRYLRAHANKYKIDADRIGVVGGSAGAHLAGLLATTPKVKYLHGGGGNSKYSSVVQAAVVMSGPMEISTGSVAERSLTAKNPVANAIFLFGGTVKEQSGLYKLADAHLHINKETPPILFQFGGKEDPSKVQPSIEKLKKLGVPTKLLTHYQDGKHGCWNRHPWFLPVIEDVDSWFQEHL